MRLFSKKTKYRQISYSQEGEDLILLNLLNRQKKGFYVDIGAFHPERFSNTKIFYDMGWSGINIEPNPDAKKRFDKKRSRDININCGVAGNLGEMIYYKFDDDALNSFSEDQVKRVISSGYKIISKNIVKTDSLENIFFAHISKETQIDFMTLDCEGMDLAVLKSNNWNLFSPKIIAVEIVSDFLALSNDECFIYLKSLGYRMVAKTPRTGFFVSPLNPT